MHRLQERKKGVKENMGFLQEISMSIWFVFGICLFSFFNVVIYRVPNHMDFVKGRSICPKCGHTLSALDLIPIISWIVLGRKCRYCKVRISSRYALVELLGGALAVVCYMTWGNTVNAILNFSFFGILTIISFVDWDTMLIPNGFVITVLCIAICACFIPSEVTIIERMIGFFCISLPMFIITIAIAGAFGGGDIKLMAASGLFLGWKLCLLSFFFAVIMGGIYGMIVLLTKKKGRKDQIPFGPFLCIGMCLAVLFGNECIAWYFCYL